MSCDKCTKNSTVAEIPFIVYEAEMERNDRQFKRMWIALILLIILLVFSNALWIWYTKQFERAETTTTTTQTVEQEAQDGDNQFVGGNYYGETESDNDNHHKIS